MNLTINNDCSIITADTSSVLEDWYNGNLSDVQVTIFYNCEQVTQFNLPNTPNLGLLTSCSVINSRAVYIAGLTGISNIVSSTLVSQSSTVDSVVKNSETEYLVTADTSGNTHQLVFDITTADGNVYRLTADATAAPNTIGQQCNFTMTYSTTIQSLPCGLSFDSNNFTLDIFNEYLQANCNTPCTNCSKYCDGIYTIQIQNELSCIFANCMTDCEALDNFAMNEGEILQLLEAVKLGSNLTSTGQTDCINCDQLCLIYNKIARILGRVTTTEIEDCGCNNY